MPQLKEDYSPRGNRARELFLQGYNCCQAVLLAFNDMTGLDDKSAARVASGFGGGIGMLRDVCGTFTGACMALGLIEGYDQPKANEIKKEYRDWMDSLPEVQRVVMERYVYGRYEFWKNDADVFRKISELRK